MTALTHLRAAQEAVMAERAQIDKSTARLNGENFTMFLRPTEDAEPHEILVSIARHPAVTGDIHEIAFVTRGKIGHGLDLMLQDLGIQLSRAIQGRNPDTGEPIK